MINFIKKIWALPWVFLILKNYAFIKESFSKMKLIVEKAVKNGGVPECEDSKILIGIIRQAFERDLLNLKSIPDHKIIDALNKIEANLVCSIDEERKRRGLR